MQGRVSLGGGPAYRKVRPLDSRWVNTTQILRAVGSQGLTTLLGFDGTSDIPDPCRRTHSNTSEHTSFETERQRHSQGSNSGSGVIEDSSKSYQTIEISITLAMQAIHHHVSCLYLPSFSILAK
jgi:hypothetical protein